MIIKTIAEVLSRIGKGLIFAGEDDRGIGVVEVILILVEKPNAKHRYVLCGN